MKNTRPKQRLNCQKGFFLVELTITMAVLIVVIVGYLNLFIYCLGLAETSGNITLATVEAQDKIEEMRNHQFENIQADYGTSPGNTFALGESYLPSKTQLNGTGYIYVFNTGNPDVLTIEIVISWLDEKNRLIGGIDEDSDGRLDSPVEVSTIITKRY
ncbi:MAG: hypothetical protein ABIA97_01310 [Candidatus Omnitrophota bacterium]